MPRSRATAAPPHDGLLVATATTSKPRSTRLRRLEPFPETTTPIFNGVPATGAPAKSSDFVGWAIWQILWGVVSGDHHAFAALVLDHLADHLGAAGDFVRVDNEDHAEPHVERPEHLVVGDAAPRLDHLEDRTDLPRATAQSCAQTFGQAARQVAEHATTRDVRSTLPGDRTELLQVRAVRFEQLFAQRAADLWENAAERHVLEDLAHQREAVCVEAAGRHTDQQIARANFLGVSHESRRNHADDDPGQVVIPERVDARHLGGLASQQRAACLTAGRGDAFDDLRENVRVELAGGEIVEEEHRAGAGRGDVVHAMVDDVDADAAMRGCSDRHLDLGADAIGAGGEMATTG